MEKKRVSRNVPVIWRKSVHARIRQMKSNSLGASARTEDVSED